MEKEAKFELDFVHEKKTFKLRYHNRTTECELATVIVYLRDVLKALFDTEKIDFLIDGEIADLKTILENLDKEVAVVAHDMTKEEFDDKPIVIYINKKNQLIRISKRKPHDFDASASRDLLDIHEILSFDINKLDQREQHDITSDRLANENVFKEPLPVIKTSMYEEDKNKEGDTSDELNIEMIPRTRKKEPIKDGISQQKFILETLKQSDLVKNPNEVFYTLEEVAKHKKADDCWTIWQGKVYDITTYIKSHPGGKKIMAGAGKDCTELFNKYHHWVNANFIIGKLQIGVVKYNQLKI